MLDEISMQPYAQYSVQIYKYVSTPGPEIIGVFDYKIFKGSKSVAVFTNVALKINDNTAELMYGYCDLKDRMIKHLKINALDLEIMIFTEVLGEVIKIRCGNQRF